MSDPVRARMWQFGGRWYAQVLDAPMFVEVTGTSRAGCLAELRTIAGDDAMLTVEIVPDTVGVAEAAEIMGWDKHHVVPRTSTAGTSPNRSRRSPVAGSGSATMSRATPPSGGRDTRRR